MFNVSVVILFPVDVDVVLPVNFDGNVSVGPLRYFLLLYIGFNEWLVTVGVGINVVVDVIIEHCESALVKVVKNPLVNRIQVIDSHDSVDVLVCVSPSVIVQAPVEVLEAVIVFLTPLGCESVAHAIVVVDSIVVVPAGIVGRHVGIESIIVEVGNEVPLISGV